MTDPLPIDVDGIDQPFPDDGHEAIRSAVLGAIQTVWGQHLALVDALAVTNAQLATTQADLATTRADLATAQQTATEQATALDALTATVADLQAAVAALQPPPSP